MLLAPVSEIEIVGVYDRGVANRERIVLRANTTIDCSQYAVVAGPVTVNAGASFIYPARDVLYYFGSGIVYATEWVIIYTGSGDALKTTMQGSGEPVYVVHWGRPTTLFADSRISPALIRVDAINILLPPVNQSQLPTGAFRAER